MGLRWALVPEKVTEAASPLSNQWADNTVKHRRQSKHRGREEATVKLSVRQPTIPRGGARIAGKMDGTEQQVSYNAADITELDDVQHTRLRPAVNLGLDVLNTALRELVDNAIEELKTKLANARADS